MVSLPESGLLQSLKERVAGLEMDLLQPFLTSKHGIHHGSYSDVNASPLLRLMPQNAYDKLATSTLNKANYHSLTRWYGILQSTPFKEPDDPVGTTGQPVRSALIPNVTARPNLPYIVRFGPYRPHGFVPGDASSLLNLTPQNAYDKLTTNTLNKTSYHSLTRRYGILHKIYWRENLQQERIIDVANQIHHLE